VKEKLVEDFGRSSVKWPMGIFGCDGNYKAYSVIVTMELLKYLTSPCDLC